MPVVTGTGVHFQEGMIYVQNTSCLPTNGTLTMVFSPKFVCLPFSTTPPATSISGNTMVWDLVGLSSELPTSVWCSYALSNAGTFLTIGDTVQTHFTISPFVGDADTTNNSYMVVDTVRAGFDPNEMWVNPSCLLSGVSPTQLQYTINFENTGNDTAHNIYVMDTLSDNLDLSTLNLEMASHEMFVYKFTDGAGRHIIKFDFPNINLLDSSHHGFCDGAVVFNIKTKPGLVMGNTIYNHAGIYFDINAVVMTNTVQTKIGGCPPSYVAQVSHEEEVFITPNPASTLVTIRTSNVMFNTATITNMMGQEVLKQILTGSNTKVDVSQLPTGVYYITLRGNDGQRVEKFVKM